MENFTPISALLGGALIGIAATLMLWINGRIAGISGILGGILLRNKLDTLWRVVFVVGMLVGGLLYSLLWGTQITFTPQSTPLLTAGAGLLVGFGTRLGSGCTSGHGICGIARISTRSITATAVFLSTAIVTVWITRHAIGWGL